MALQKLISNAFASLIARSGRARLGTLQNEPSAWTLELLKQLEWRRFEELCVAYFEMLGFTVKTPRHGAEGVADIDLYDGASGKRSIIARCEGWNAHTIGFRRVRDLQRAMTDEKVGEGLFVTSGKFTREARDFATKENIALIDGTELLRKIGLLVPEQSTALLKLASRGDFTTPTCPICSVKMLSAQSTEGGRKYWKCRNYPRCKHTFFVGNRAPA